MTSVSRHARSLPLAFALFAALVFMLLPERAASPLKRATTSLLAPGQKLAVGARQWAARRIELFQSQLASADEQLAAAEEIAELRRRKAELEEALAISLAHEHSLPATSGETRVSDAPFVRADLVPRARARPASAVFSREFRVARRRQRPTAAARRPRFRRRASECRSRTDLGSRKQRRTERRRFSRLPAARSPASWSTSARRQQRCNG